MRRTQKLIPRFLFCFENLSYARTGAVDVPTPVIESVMPIAAATAAESWEHCDHRRQNCRLRGEVNSRLCHNQIVSRRGHCDCHQQVCRYRNDTVIMNEPSVVMTARAITVGTVVMNVTTAFA